MSGIVFAAVTTKTPADITFELTGKTAAQVIEEKASGKTYGSIAQEAGKLEKFKTENLTSKKQILDQRVAEGTLTQEKADNISGPHMPYIERLRSS